MGKIFLPAAPVTWNAELLGQLTRFPAGRFDDGVDVCSLLGRGLEHIKPPRIAKPVEHRHADMSRGPNHWKPDSLRGQLRAVARENRAGD
jgi:hypothetical protein